MLATALVGARGYVGAELLKLLRNHGGFDLKWAISRGMAGRPVRELMAGPWEDLIFVDLDPEELASQAPEIVLLALPNGEAPAWVAALDRADCNPVVLDLSADFRFDPSWSYGLSELNRAAIANSRRIANPGCYATAMQLALAPFRGEIEGPAVCFGISGFSGAGVSRNERNDPERLRRNVLPYSSIGHLHEREVRAQLCLEVDFLPNVAPFFRGLSITANLHLKSRYAAADLLDRLREYYRGEPLVEVREHVPSLSEVSGEPSAVVGGVVVSENDRRAVVFSALDNLLKGAATQALQNLNLACGYPELEGIRS